MPEITIALSMDDFRKIVAGRAVDVEVKIRGVQWWIRIGLKEIDVPGMVEAFRDAVEGLSSEVQEKPAPVQKAPDLSTQERDRGAEGDAPVVQGGGGS